MTYTVKSFFDLTRMLLFPGMFYLFISFSGCTSILSSENAGLKNGNTVDRAATSETRALFQNLRRISGNGILFGQEDATLYGLNWRGDTDRSDVKSVSGSHPAVYGWDLEQVVKAGLGEKVGDPAIASKIAEQIRQSYDRGGVNTLSWHMQNFVTGKNFYDTTRTVYAILPGGNKHEAFTASLDQVAAFIQSLKGSDGKQVPVIFRPFHEHTGSWFWWGKRFCTPDEYKNLWRFTVGYLRDKKNIHSILYAYSPDRIRGDFSEYLERYPGDDYVDILGFDNYSELKNFDDTLNTGLAIKSLKLITDYARSRNKVAALTETGLEKIVNPEWFSMLLERIKADPDASRISYMMVWRNAHEGHFYAPYPGHSSVPDFLKFYNDPYTLFQNDIKNFYVKGKELKTN